MNTIATIGSIVFGLIAIAPALSTLFGGSDDESVNGAANENKNERADAKDLSELSQAVKEYEDARGQNKIIAETKLHVELSDVENKISEYKTQIAESKAEIHTAEETVRTADTVLVKYSQPLRSAREAVNKLSIPAQNETPEQKAERETKLNIAKTRLEKYKKEVDFAEAAKEKALKTIETEKQAIATKTEAKKELEAEAKVAQEALKKLEEKKQPEKTETEKETTQEPKKTESKYLFEPW